MTRYWWNSFYLGSIPIETQKKIPDTQIVLLVTLESLEKKAKRQIFGRHFGRHLVTTKVATRKKFFFETMISDRKSNWNIFFWWSYILI